MTSYLQQSSPPFTGQYVGPAEVTGRPDAVGHLPIRLPSSPEWQQHDAVPAIDEGSNLQEGDQVLVVTGDGETFYITGVIRRRCRQVREYPLTGGKRVCVDEQQGEVKLLDHNQSLLLQYSATTGALRIGCGKEDIIFETGGSIRMLAEKSVEIHGGERTEIVAERCDVGAEEIQLRAEVVESVAARQRFVGQRVDFIFETMMNTLRNLYQNVAELLQHKTRQQRTIVEETDETMAGQIRQRASGDFKVNAEHIHLG